MEKNSKIGIVLVLISVIAVFGIVLSVGNGNNDIKEQQEADTTKKAVNNNGNKETYIHQEPTVKEQTIKEQTIKEPITEQPTTKYIEPETNSEGFYVLDESLKDLSFNMYDINHDGKKEKLLLDLSCYDGSQPAFFKFTDDNGKEIYKVDLYSANIGRAAYFICTIDNVDYILKYIPDQGQGSYNYAYELFYLNQDLSINVVEENSFDFGSIVDFDTKVVSEFYDKINGIVEQGNLIISTVDGNLLYNTEGDYSTKMNLLPFINENDDQIKYSKNDSIYEKIEKYRIFNVKQFITANRVN